MLNGIETIFDNTTQMLRHLKKKSFEKNTQDFIDSYGHYFREMTEYVDSISDKKRAAEEIADTLINRVEKKFASKKGKIDSRTQVDLDVYKRQGICRTNAYNFGRCCSGTSGIGTDCNIRK